jgi:hypothetical protein
VQPSDSSSRLADPIIITGPPRAGVQLLAALLDGHRSFASGPELPVIITMARQWQEISETLGANHAQHYALKPDDVRQAFRTALLRLWSPRLNATGKRRFVMPSFAAVAFLKLLAALLPNARLVLVTRDPRDVVASLFRCDWRSANEGKRLPVTVDVRSATQLWVDSMQIALAGAQELAPSGRVTLIRYEDLCADPLASMRGLASFVGEESLPVAFSPESAALVNVAAGNPLPPLQPGAIRGASVGRWRTVLTASDQRLVESVAGPLFAKFARD